MHTTKERVALLGLWLIPALWSVNYIVARWAPGVVTPYTLALGRWGIAGLLLVAVAWRELWQERAHLAATWYQYVVLGFCGMLVCGAWVYLGARTTVAMNIALIYSASPVLIAVGAALFLGERFRLPQVVGVLLALAGVVHVIVKGQWLALAQVQWVAGDAWIVAAMVSWAAYALLQKLWPSPLGSTARLAAICVGGVAVLLPCAAWELAQPATPSWSWSATGLVLTAALLPGVGAYWLYGSAQKVLGASRVAATLYLAPLFAALAAWGVLGEPLGWHHLVGAALILPGVYGVSRR
jgi:drug/metabolite transporter (DMT)-like permease